MQKSISKTYRFELKPWKSYGVKNEVKLGKLLLYQAMYKK